MWAVLCPLQSPRSCAPLRGPVFGLENKTWLDEGRETWPQKLFQEKVWKTYGGFGESLCVFGKCLTLSRVLKLTSSSQWLWGLPRANLNNYDFHSSKSVPYCYLKWICIYNIHVNLYYIHVCVLCVCAHVEVRGKMAEVSSLLPHLGIELRSSGLVTSVLSSEQSCPQRLKQPSVIHL